MQHEEDIVSDTYMLRMYFLEVGFEFFQKCSRLQNFDSRSQKRIFVDAILDQKLIQYVFFNVQKLL